MRTNDLTMRPITGHEELDLFSRLPYVLNEELAEYKHVACEQARFWPAATGYALRDWLRGKGYDPQEVPPPFK